jgi:hypothetical protein
MNISWYNVKKYLDFLHKILFALLFRVTFDL